MPSSVENRQLVHREFTANIENVKSSVRAHLVNCIKTAATTMTSSENQTSRKAEFAKIIGDQLVDGLYRFKRVEVAVLDISGQPKLAENGKPMTAFATAIVRDKDDMPMIDAQSPLEQYGIEVAQFSITGIKYDPQTLEQFAKKKEASLKAELAKIQVEQAKQETQTKIEEGKRMKAEKDAEMSVQVAQARGEAEMLVTTAEQNKLQAAEIKEKAVIEANQAKEVAVIDANQKQEVAVIQLAAAQLDAQAKIVLAEARQKEIDLAGFITEKERVLAEIAKERDIGVADKLSGLQLPDKVIMTGGSGSGDGANQLFSVLGVNQTLDLMDKLSRSDLTAPPAAAVAAVAKQ
jgi:hypothetical protein